VERRNRGNSACHSARNAIAADTRWESAPAAKPVRRPKRVNSNAAGVEASMVEAICTDIGRVASALFAASEWPISAAIATWPLIAAWLSDWQRNRSATFRRWSGTEAVLIRGGSSRRG
jgi:hypothetical protein